MAASANVNRIFADGARKSIPVAASAVIYDGTVVGLNGSGYARALTAGDKYAGFARFGAVTGGSAAGDVKVDVDPDCYVRLTVVGATSEEDKGKFVYASDDGTFTLAAGAPGATTRIGRVFQWISSTTCIVHAYVEADNDAERTTAIPAEVTTAGAVTLTAAQILAGLILRDCGGAHRADLMPAAAVVWAALRAPRVGQAIDFTIRNTSDGAETITLTTDTGATVTMSGTMTVAQNNSKAFRLVFTSATAATCYSLGTVVH